MSSVAFLGELHLVAPSMDGCRGSMSANSNSSADEGMRLSHPSVDQNLSLGARIKKFFRIPALQKSRIPQLCVMPGSGRVQQGPGGSCQSPGPGSIVNANNAAAFNRSMMADTSDVTMVDNSRYKYSRECRREARQRTRGGQSLPRSHLVLTNSGTSLTFSLLPDISDNSSSTDSSSDSSVSPQPSTSYSTHAVRFPSKIPRCATFSGPCGSSASLDCHMGKSIGYPPQVGKGKARLNPYRFISPRSVSPVPKRGRGHHRSQSAQVANFGPADYNYDETISTLRYANRAKNIKNNARVNEDPKDALLRQFQKEIEALRRQLEEGGGELGDDGEESSEYETDSGSEVDETGQPKKRKKKKEGRKGNKGISKEKMNEIQSQIQEDRRKLESQKDMAEEEKKRVEEDLAMKESELKQAQEQQAQLHTKLQAIEKKIIVGGENLLEKAEEQERMLEESSKELETKQKKAETLRKAYEEKEQERLDIEEKYSNLQEEAAGKTKKLKKVWTMLMQAKSEMADMQQEHQREMEGLLENVRQLSRELRLQMLIIDSFIPPEYQEMIEQYVHWNEDIGEWQLKCVAYSGNNMRKQSPVPDKDKEKNTDPDLTHVYLAYTAESAEEAMRVSKSGGAKANTSKGKSGRPKTSNRPKTSKKKRKDADIDSVLH